MTGISRFGVPVVVGPANDDHFVATVDGDMLRSFAADAPHQLAESGLGVLQQPAAGWMGWLSG
jgi:hypothetical protein